MTNWTPLISALIAASAALGGAYVGARLSTRGQARAARRERLEDAYATVLAAAHDVELHIRAKRGRVRELPSELDRALTTALCRANLLAPFDTHEAVDEWAGKLRRLDIQDELAANDVLPNVERWQRALSLMRRDLEALE